MRSPKDKQTHSGRWAVDQSGPPTPTDDLDLHDVALEIGLAIDHSTYDTLYVAFAIAMGARGLVAADGGFVRDMRRHPDPALAGLLVPLQACGRERGLP